MRYEIMRLLQFVFSLSLVLAAFACGMFVGWRRWGRRGPVDHSEPTGSSATAEGPGADRFEVPGRRDLFAPELDLAWSEPEVDLRVETGPHHLGLPAGSSVSASAGPSPEALA